IHHETRSGSAGIFGVFLVMLGWYMPAYAVNWGKYPALSSLPLILFVLSLAYLSLRYRAVLSSRHHMGLNVLLLLSVLVAGFTHSRSLVVFAIFLLAWLIAIWWTGLSKGWRSLIFLTLLLGIAALAFYIDQKGIFGPLFDPYWDKGVLVTAIVAVLSIPALRAYPRLGFTSILVILLLIGSLFVPANGIPGYGNLTLLDRPFVETILYLPLSLLGGLGLAALEQSVRAAQMDWKDFHFAWGKYVAFFCIAVVLISELSRYNFYPSDCCAIAGRDDLVALDWMDKNLPPEARILIASTELRVLASNSFEGSVSGDAGAWITPLTGRATVFLPFQSDFTQQATLDTLCLLQADHIYVGETGVKFNNALLLARPDWYQILLSMPTVQVYQVTGCP
ncbi:MAG TPA: hypothetical protein VFY25_08705, partial [Anaerolineales bacterium]|nr:hypothetical protein [Anaerolineales bacterium]